MPRAALRSTGGVTSGAPLQSRGRSTEDARGLGRALGRQRALPSRGTRATARGLLQTGHNAAQFVQLFGEMLRGVVSDATFNRSYRSLLSGTDELVPTSLVRELLKGVMEEHKIAPLSAPAQARLEELFQKVSQVRIPTRWSGFARRGPSPGTVAEVMQHPTGRGRGMWRRTVTRGDGSSPLHSKLDRERREAIQAEMRAAVGRGADAEGIVHAGLRRAVEFTLNEFTGPASASDLVPEPGVSPQEIDEQVNRREEIKRWAVSELGATQQAGLRNRVRAWLVRKGMRELSPSR